MDLHHSSDQQRPIYVIGDIHGHYEKLVHLLYQSNLIDNSLNWSGGDSTLLCIGDYVDRGPQGIECIDLIMHLQTSAQENGGEVVALLGNHEVLLLGAYLFAGDLSYDDPNVFMQVWRKNGGLERDLRSLTVEHAKWISELPAMVLLGDRLCFHADDMFYITYGDTIEEINESFQEVMECDIQRIWLRLINEFAGRYAFSKDMDEGKVKVQSLLELYGGTSLIHGHTPISHVVDIASHNIVGPLVYANSLCMNVDGGLGHDGQGFIYQFMS